ncbi:MAG: fused MFS/spermidine synthase [Planctomycetota bacterium]|jgi:MFS family permease
MLLRVVVFICGAVVMSLEILAARYLQVAFGSGLHVWGALIGTFIGALSVGYWLGGASADRWPTRLGIGVILTLSGLLVTLTVLYTDPVIEFIWALNGGKNLVEGGWLKPVIASAVLYGPAVVLLGSVSPYAIRLASRDLLRLGRRVGGFYAISSVGSIFGTFLTAFHLIAKFRGSVTMMAEGLILLALSVPVYAAGFFFEDGPETPRKDGA